MQSKITLQQTAKSFELGNIYFTKTVKKTSWGEDAYMLVRI